MHIHETIPGGFSIDKAKSIEVAKSLAANRYVGIGVKSMMKDGKFVFMEVMEGGTADEAGSNGTMSCWKWMGAAS